MIFAAPLHFIQPVGPLLHHLHPFVPEFRPKEIYAKEPKLRRNDSKTAALIAPLKTVLSRER
jgi:hypothetical protein